MDGSLEGLEPKTLWIHFQEISAIPRCSGNEERVRAYVLRFAEKEGLPFAVDSAGNVLVRKGAQRSSEGAPCVVLQSHLDMVCEKNLDTVHDFQRDPIRLVRAGDWLAAQGTTLGADNGIGVAAMLAVLEDRSLVHGGSAGRRGSRKASFQGRFSSILTARRKGPLSSAARAERTRSFGFPSGGSGAHGASASN